MFEEFWLQQAIQKLCLIECKPLNQHTCCTLAIPVLAYSFHIVDWKMEEIRQLDRKTRKLLTLQRMHHPKADMDRMYLLRSEGGRGLIQLQTAYKRATIGLDTYLNTKNDPLLVIAKEPEKKNKQTKKKVSISSQATIFNFQPPWNTGTWEWSSDCLCQKS